MTPMSLLRPDVIKQHKPNLKYLVYVQSLKSLRYVPGVVDSLDWSTEREAAHQ